MQTADHDREDSWGYAPVGSLLSPILTDETGSTSYQLAGFDVGESLRIQIPPMAMDLFCGNQTMAQAMSSLGFGRVRADFSAPMEGDPERVWLQNRRGANAVLVMKQEASSLRGARFLHLGRLRMASYATDQPLRFHVWFVCGESYLPGASEGELERLVRQRLVWGGLVTTIVETA